MQQHGSGQRQTNFSHENGQFNFDMTILQNSQDSAEPQIILENELHFGI